LFRKKTRASAGRMEKRKTAAAGGGGTGGGALGHGGCPAGKNGAIIA